MLSCTGEGVHMGEKDGKFHVWTYFILNFSLGLIFLRVCLKDDPIFETRQITRTIYYICCCVYTFINMFIEHSGYIKTR